MSSQNKNPPVIELKDIMDNIRLPLNYLDTEASQKYRFFKINELPEGSATEYHLAMVNVLSNVSNNNDPIVYLLSGKKTGIDLYLGVTTNNRQKLQADFNLLFSAFEGNLRGATIKSLPDNDKLLEELNYLISNSSTKGLILGHPTFNEENSNLDSKDFQGIERLINSLSGEEWQLIIVAKPGEDKEIKDFLESLLSFSTELSSQVKITLQQSSNTNSSKSIVQRTSKSDTTSKSATQTQNSTSNTSEQVSDSSNKTDSSNKENTTTIQENKGTTRSSEITNKHVEKLQLYLDETQIPRFLSGRSKGMFQVAIYACAQNANIFKRLSRSIISIFQGSQASFSPLSVQMINSKLNSLESLLKIQTISYDVHKLKRNHRRNLVHNIPTDEQFILASTWLTTQELALLTGLPCTEVPGIKIRKNVSFALNTPQKMEESHIELGSINQNGRILDNTKIQLPLNALNKHTFITGVTGTGKTTTCMRLLADSKLPFTVIEPAKTEYRALYEKDNSIEYYSLGREDLCTFRINPFELVSKKQSLTGNISMLKATLCAVFPMEASMPFMVEQAIIQAYQKKGWNIVSSKNELIDDPWNTTEKVWPTFSDMINELDDVIKSAKMGFEFEEKYRGSLVSRLSALTKGIKGIMVNTPRSIDFKKLLEKKVVIELEELKDEEDKAFFMGIIINRISECMKQRHLQRKSGKETFQHITLIEEAHRLLSQPEPGAEGSKKQGVETFANLLAEVRKYGECLVIADQIPNKLIPDVIKNTNTKIVHRLFAADDRKAIGDSIGLNNEQKDFLPMLETGESIIYSGGWHAAVRAQITPFANTTGLDIPEEEIRNQGQKQLWENKQIILPALTQVTKTIISDATHFSNLYNDTRELLNLLVRFNKAFKEHPHDSLTSDIAIRIHKCILTILNQNKTYSQKFITSTTIALLQDSYYKTILTDDIIHLTNGLNKFFEMLDENSESLSPSNIHQFLLNPNSNIFKEFLRIAPIDFVF